MKSWCKKKNPNDEKKKHGYSSITKKSLDFDDARFRECLMIMSTLCQEV